MKVQFKDCIISGSSSLIPGLPKNNKSILTSKTALDLDSVQIFSCWGRNNWFRVGASMRLRFKGYGGEFLPNLVPGADPDLMKL